MKVLQIPTAVAAGRLTYGQRSVYLLVFLSLVSFPAGAAVEFYTPFNNFVFNTWVGVGNVSQSQTGCIVAYSNPFYLFGSPRDYRLRADMDSPAPSPSSPYAFYNISNSAYSFPFTLELMDLHGSGTQTLNPAAYSTNMTYDPYCSNGSPPNGPNAELTININAADMYSVPAGNYRVTLDLTAQQVGGGSGASTATQNNLLGTITIPPLAQISNIDDISLGAYDGVSPSVSYNEAFCVYINTAAYVLVPSSSISGATPGSFALDSSGDRLEYTVRVNNTADASSGALLTNGQASGSLGANQSTPLSMNCNGGDNAAVYLEFGGVQLQSAPPGNYSGVLNLMVAPI